MITICFEKIRMEFNKDKCKVLHLVEIINCSNTECKNYKYRNNWQLLQKRMKQLQQKWNMSQYYHAASQTAVTMGYVKKELWRNPVLSSPNKRLPKML